MDCYLESVTSYLLPNVGKQDSEILKLEKKLLKSVRDITSQATFSEFISICSSDLC